jgi:curved DNA-binding protein CbpA
VAEANLIDYYAILSLPPRADLMGIENAYARLSDDFARQMEVDDTSKEALVRLNEAYSVLSRPELRREYDRAFFRRELDALERQEKWAHRRRMLAEKTLLGALVGIVAAQAGVLLYLGWGEATGLLSALWGLAF